MENEKTFDEIYDELLEKIVDLIEEKKFKEVRDLFIEELTTEADAAELLEGIIDRCGVESAVIVFRMLPKAVSVEVFAYLPIDDQVSIINKITDKEIQFIMDEMDFDDMIDVMEELPATIVNKILEQTPKEERKLINTFLNYPEDSAGSIMTPDYISLMTNWTVRQAMQHIQQAALDSETIYTCYVKDWGRKLTGIVSLRALVIADDDMKIRDLMHDDFISVNVYDDQEVVSEAFKKYDFLAVPVVDNEQRLVGIITVDDIIDVIEEEATEDIERMAGIIDSSDKEYLDMSVFHHVKKRLPWLLVVMCSYMITGGIIADFEAALSKVICLVAYMPMLMGTGGNSGSQSATLIIRGMSTDEIDTKDALRVIWKELRVSFIVGFSLSALNFLRIVFIDGNGVPVACAVCAAMLVIVMAAKSIGSMLPMIAKKVGIDPALMAAPLISSLTDMVSVITYFVLASKILGI